MCIGPRAARVQCVSHKNTEHILDSLHGLTDRGWRGGRTNITLAWGHSDIKQAIGKKLWNTRRTTIKKQAQVWLQTYIFSKVGETIINSDKRLVRYE